MTKLTTSDLKPGDRLILPISKEVSEVITVHAVHPYSPGILEMFSRDERHDRVVYYQREPVPGRSHALIASLTCTADRDWLPA